MTFDRVEKPARSTPHVTVWSVGKLAFNEAAVDAWFAEAPAVDVLLHETDPLVGLVPVAADEGYTLQSQGSFNGRLVEARRLLSMADCSRPDEATPLNAWYDPDERMACVDLAPLR